MRQVLSTNKLDFVIILSYSLFVFLANHLQEDEILPNEWQTIKLENNSDK